MALENYIIGASNTGAAGYHNAMAGMDQRKREAEADRHNAYIRQRDDQAYRDKMMREALEQASMAYSDEDGGETAYQGLANMSAQNGWPIPEKTFILPVMKTLSQQYGGADAYGSIVYGEDAEGNPVVMQPTKGGGLIRPRLPEGVSRVTLPTKTVDLGDQVIQVPTRGGGGPVNSYGKGVAPEKTPAFQADVAGAEAEAKARVKKQSTFPKVKALIKSEETQNKFVLDTISNAVALAGKAAGYGEWLAWVNSTDYKTLSKELETIKANIAFGKLQEMRNNSPTGGALGNVSDSENKRLEAVAGSLDQGLNPEVLIRNLNRLAEMRTETLENMRGGFQEDYAEFLTQEPAEVAPQTSTNVDDLVNKYAPRP